MRRTLVALALVASVVTPAWLRLEAGDFPLGEVLAVLLCALFPTLALVLARGWRVFVGVTGLSTLLAASVAFGIPVSEARLGGEHDFFGPVLSGFQQGFLEFSDVRVPYSPVDYPFMHSVVLMAVFGFVAAAGIALALRRSLPALAILVVGAGWPSTMLSTWVDSDRPLLFGAVILAAALALLVILRPGSRGLAQAAAAALAIVAVSVAGSTTDAVAKQGFINWDTWDFYDPPEKPVDVRYGWDANYDGIDFPDEETTVLKIKVTGPRRALYWRATTLDDYTGQVWRENLEAAEGPEEFEEIDVRDADPLLPRELRERRLESFVRQDVTVEALEDSHLIGSGQVVQWEPGTSAPATVGVNGVVRLGEPLRRGQRYTVWSYVPAAKPAELEESGTSYPDEARRYLRGLPDPNLEPLPEFGAIGRDAAVRRFFQEELLDASHADVYDTALEVTQNADTPYKAVVLLEAWFRGSEGGFTYTEQPPVTPPNVPPLSHFLLETKRGYCQHYAGAMALMLRYLGIPARVAAGFTSGSYNEGDREWTVTDHDAHTWVEAYFPGRGWIPFDPTPNRGQLFAAYTPFSPAFDAREAGQIGGGLLDVPEIREQVGQASGLEQREPDAGGGGGGVPSAVAETGRSILGLIFLLGGVGVAAILLVKETRRRIRFRARGPRAVAGACRQDLAGFMADQGFETPPSLTLRELCELVADRFSVNATPFLEVATVARYAKPAEGRHGNRRLRSELRRLRRRMSRQLGLGQRLRGALSLRSLSA